MATEIRTLLDEGAAQLGRVADAPRREAELLLGAALGRTRAWLLAHPEERILDCEATDRYEAYVTRRRLGEPVAYLLGEKEFWSLPLAVGPGVLIPRPETELLVERALAHLPTERPCKVLDLATGSGAVALAIAQERPLGRIVATDCATVAVVTARANAARLGLADRVQVLAGEWYAPVASQAFDLVVSNPPYIAADDPRVEPAVRRFEPREALFAGPTGLEALQHIVAHAPGHLVAGGWLVLEHGDLQGEAVRALLQATGFVAVRTSRDLAGRERCTEGRRPSDGGRL
jgi:release factor glutamine methyltransferase